MPLRRWQGLGPRELAGEAVCSSIKTDRETSAFRIANKVGVAQPGFDADAVSPYCSWGDPDSPLGSAPVMRELVPTRRQPRSSIADPFRARSKEYPPLWRLMDAEARRLARGDDDDPILTRKARHLLGTLQAPPADEP